MKLLLFFVIFIFLFASTDSKKVFRIKHGKSVPGEDLNNNGLAKNSTKNKYSSAKIQYYKGPIMTGNTVVHSIFYGSNFTNAELTLYNKFLDNLTGSRWWNITEQYYSLKKNVKTHAGNIVRGETLFNMGYPLGSSLSDSQIINIIDLAFTNNGTGATGPNDIYVVMTDRFVTATSGLCSYYCGYHSYRRKSGIDQKYIYVGSPLRCPSGCSALSENGSDSPNGLFQMDSMISVIAHELSEVETDPTFKGWMTRAGEENADLCAWTYGTVSTFGGGRFYNELLGPDKYLIQRNWAITPAQKCVQ